MGSTKHRQRGTCVHRLSWGSGRGWRGITRGPAQCAHGKSALTSRKALAVPPGTPVAGSLLPGPSPPRSCPSLPLTSLLLKLQILPLGFVGPLTFSPSLFLFLITLAMSRGEGGQGCGGLCLHSPKGLQHFPKRCRFFPSRGTLPLGSEISRHLLKLSPASQFYCT